MTSAMKWELRVDGDGVFDELVVRNPTYVHIERMDEKRWWMGVGIPGYGDGLLRLEWTGDVPVVDTSDIDLQDQQRAVGKKDAD